MFNNDDDPGQATCAECMTADFTSTAPGANWVQALAFVTCLRWLCFRRSPITLICHFFQNFNDSNHLLLSLFQMIFSVILITFVTCLGWMTVFVCHYFCFKFHSSLVAIYWTSSTIYWTSSTDKLFLASRHPLMILLPLYGRVKKNYMSVLHNFLNFHPA